MLHEPPPAAGGSAAASHAEDADEEAVAGSALSLSEAEDPGVQRLVAAIRTDDAAIAAGLLERHFPKVVAGLQLPLPVLLVGVRASVAQGDCSAAETYSRKLRADFGNSREALVMLPQVLGSCARATSL